MVSPRRTAVSRTAVSRTAVSRTGAARAVALITGAMAVGALAVGAPAGAGTAVTAAWKLRLAIQYLPPDTNNSQYQVVLIEAGQPWLFGGSDVFGRGRPEVERIVNGIPRSMTLPSRPYSWIDSASATSSRDIWAVTYLGGSVLHWDGSTWVVEPKGAWKAGTRFTGITAISSGDVWLFGTGGRRYQGAGTWHWTGTGWTQAKGVAAGIYQASQSAAVSHADIWAIGEIAGSMDALLHFDGSRWRHLSPSALAGFLYSHVLALGPGDVWVAGSLAGSPELGHYDGHSWTALTMPGTVAATGICRDGNGGIWVIANSAASPSQVFDRSASGTWRTVTVSSGKANELLACGLVPGTAVAWGAGKSAAPLGSAAAAYRYH